MYKERQILCQAVSVFFIGNSAGAFYKEKSSARMILFVLHRVNFTIFLVGVMWYGMYKGGGKVCRLYLCFMELL